MDERRFDGLARALGGATTRRGAVAALAGLLAAGTGMDGQAKGRRKRCNPACAAGQTCVKGECVCENGGTPCGANCCAIGQVCREGQCGAPEPPVCIPFGEACKGVGRRCCAGTVCASGQAGQHDVACWTPAGGACERTAECVFGSSCTGGVCVADPPPGRCTVCAGGCPFSTIEAAVAAAAPGDVITIAGGDYAPAMAPVAESGGIFAAGLKILKPLTLAACAPGAEVRISCRTAPPAPLNYCIWAEAEDVTLEGLSLRGPGNTGQAQGGVIGIGAAKLLQTGPSSLTVRDCSLSAMAAGVQVASSTTGASTMLVEGSFALSDIDTGISTIVPNGGQPVTVTCDEPATFTAVRASCDTQSGGTVTGCGCQQ